MILFAGRAGVLSDRRVTGLSGEVTAGLVVEVGRFGRLVRTRGVPTVLGGGRKVPGRSTRWCLSIGYWPRWCTCAMRSRTMY